MFFAKNKRQYGCYATLVDYVAVIGQRGLALALKAGLWAAVGHLFFVDIQSFEYVCSFVYHGYQ